MLPARLLSLASSVVSRVYFSAVSRSAPDAPSVSSTLHVLAKRSDDNTEFIIFACLIPVLVILSGIFAGLTLGYMSLDETQLNVLSISGTPKQKEYAKKIKPIRKNGHLLLVTLLLANMIVNETLPVISDPVLGGGFVSVVVSTVLIVLFAEIIPQSVCTRYGLYIGAKMAGPTQILVYAFAIVAWPVARLLEYILGPQHGIIYRRAELKELIAMHSDAGNHGGDLRSDTVSIIGATLDVQEKVVMQAMTPIDKVYMLSIDAKLDYDTLRRIYLTGHSRIPVYEEVEVNQALLEASTDVKSGKLVEATNETVTVKRIIGILLVKQCVLLDPEDTISLRKLRLNKPLFVPQNEHLLGMLDRFQEGHSHMAIVSRISIDTASDVKKAVKKGLTTRLRETAMNDSSSSSSSSSSESEGEVEVPRVLKWGRKKMGRDRSVALQKDEAFNGELTVTQTSTTESIHSDNEHDHGRFREQKSGFSRRGRKKVAGVDAETASKEDLELGDTDVEKQRDKKLFPSPMVLNKGSPLEQTMPADAVLTKEAANEYIRIQGFDPAIMPFGIVTLEDVLEELIGEEIYDEFDPEGAHSQDYVPPGAQMSDHLAGRKFVVKKSSTPELSTCTTEAIGNTKKSFKLFGIESSEGTSVPAGGATAYRGIRNLTTIRPITRPSPKTLGFLRSRSVPLIPRNRTAVSKSLPFDADVEEKDGSANASVTKPTNEDGAMITVSEAPRPANQSTVSSPALSVTNAGLEIRIPAQIVESPSPSISSPGHDTEPPDYPFPANNPHGNSDRVRIANDARSTATISAPESPTSLAKRSSPPLEAILLERKRRAQLQALGSVPPKSRFNSEGSPGAMVMGTGIKIGSPTVKGKGFKSSPSSGDIIAEDVFVTKKVKRQKRQKRKETLSMNTSAVGERATHVPEKDASSGAQSGE